MFGSQLKNNDRRCLEEKTVASELKNPVSFRGVLISPCPPSRQRNGWEVPDCWSGGPSGGCSEPVPGGVHGFGEEKHTSHFRPLLLKGRRGC